MKHLNPELKKLEERIAPGITIILPPIYIGPGGDTSNTDSGSGSNGSTSVSSCEGNS